MIPTRLDLHAANVLTRIDIPKVILSDVMLPKNKLLTIKERYWRLTNLVSLPEVRQTVGSKDKLPPKWRTVTHEKTGLVIPSLDPSVNYLFRGHMETKRDHHRWCVCLSGGRWNSKGQWHRTTIHCWSVTSTWLAKKGRGNLDRTWFLNETSRIQTIHSNT